MAVGVVSTDPEWRIRAANPALCAMLDAAAEDLIGKDLSSFSVPECRTRCLGLLAEALQTGGAGFISETQLMPRTGPPISVRVSVSVLWGATGRVDGFVAIVEDVSALRAAELARRAALEQERAARAEAEGAMLRLQAIFKAIPGAHIALAAGDFRVVGVSDGYLVATGTERPSLIGRAFFDALPDAVPKTSAEALRASLRRVAETGIPEWMPLQRWTIPDGQGATTERVWRWFNSPVLDATGAVECIIHRAEDVTEREADRARTIQLLRLMRVAGHAARVGGWEADLGTGRIAWTDEACLILDLPPGRPSSVRPVLRLIVREHRRPVLAALRACLRKGTTFDTEVEILSAWGSRKWVRIVAEAMRDGRGRTRAIAGAVQNVSERKAVEEASRRLSEQVAARIGTISDAFFTLDSRFRITYANPIARKILGLSSESLLGEAVWSCPGFEQDGAIGRRLRAAADDQRVMSFEELLQPTGQWLDVHVFPTADGLTVTLHDLTRRRQEQERLRLLEACVSNMTDMVVITEASPLSEPGPRIVFVNDAFVRRTGFTREETIGRSPRILQGRSSQREELDRIRRHLSEWKPVRAEIMNRTKTGEEYWTELEIQPVSDAAGRITHFVSVMRETTDRRRYQNQLEEQAALLDEVQDGIAVRAMDGRVTYMNRGAERLYGFSAEEVIGRSAFHVYEDPEVIEGPMQELIRTGRWTGRFTQRRKDGSRLIVEARWTLMRHTDGSPRAILSVNTDITEKLELEERLRQSQRLEAVGQLTGGVAHDFNNLLTVILGNAETMVESFSGDQELREMAETTMRAAERGAELTSRLLAFSRRQALDPKVVDVNALLLEFSAMLRRTLGGNIELRFVPAEKLWHALIDPPQLENAVLNLCINARDAMRSGGTLTIETRNMRLDAEDVTAAGDLTPGQYVVIAVSDTGDGMPSEVAARAFEPFFTTKEVGQGSGLGLSMVYGFMKQSGGHASIYSTPGLGTSVRMYIPRAQGRSVPAAKRAAVRQAGGSEKVLLVEDDPMVREHVAVQLRELGYVVVVVANAAEAVEALRDTRDFDLLFTDVVMPGGMNGLELAAEARRSQPSLAVLLTSGYTENALARHGALQPGVMMLSKPYRRRELAEAIRQALDRLAV